MWQAWLADLCLGRGTPQRTVTSSHPYDRKSGRVHAHTYVERKTHGHSFFNSAHPRHEWAHIITPRSCVHSLACPSFSTKNIPTLSFCKIDGDICQMQRFAKGPMLCYHFFCFPLKVACPKKQQQADRRPYRRRTQQIKSKKKNFLASPQKKLVDRWN